MATYRPPMIDGVQTPAFSPDGRRLAFTGIRNKSELWVIHNLMSGLRAEKPL